MEKFLADINFRYFQKTIMKNSTKYWLFILCFLFRLIYNDSSFAL